MCHTFSAPSLQFWLFASQITGVADLMERAELLVPAKIPEEFLLLEKPIALEFNRFALALVVEGGVKASMKVSLISAKSDTTSLMDFLLSPLQIDCTKYAVTLNISPIRNRSSHSRKAPSESQVFTLLLQNSSSYITKSTDFYTSLKQDGLG